MTRRKTQKGFSLLELLVAMMIIAVISTLGFRKYQEFTARAHHLTSQSTLKIVGEGIDQYYMKHGKYPDFGSFEAMVDAGSPLVKENMIPANTPSRDGFDQPFEGKCSKVGYEIATLGDPNNQEDRPKYTRKPGEISGGPATGSGKGPAPAGGAAPEAKPGK